MWIILLAAYFVAQSMAGEYISCRAYPSHCYVEYCEDEDERVVPVRWQICQDILQQLTEDKQLRWYSRAELGFCWYSWYDRMEAEWKARNLAIGEDIWLDTLPCHTGRAGCKRIKLNHMSSSVIKAVIIALLSIGIWFMVLNVTSTGIFTLIMVAYVLLNHNTSPDKKYHSYGCRPLHP